MTVVEQIIEKSKTIENYIQDNYELFVTRTGWSKDPNEIYLLLIYDNYNYSKTLYVSIYNDIEFGYLVNDNIAKEILISEDCNCYNDLKVAIEIFNTREA